MSSPRSRKQTPAKSAPEEEVVATKSPAKSAPQSARKTPARSRSQTPAKASRQATPKRTPAKSPAKATTPAKSPKAATPAKSPKATTPAKSPKAATPAKEEQGDCGCGSACKCASPCTCSPGKRGRSSSGTPSPTKKPKVGKKSTMAETSSEGKSYLASTDIPTHGKATRKAKEAKKSRRSK